METVSKYMRDVKEDEILVFTTSDGLYYYAADTDAYLQDEEDPSSGGFVWIRSVTLDDDGAAEQITSDSEECGFNWTKSRISVLA